MENAFKILKSRNMQIFAAKTLLSQNSADSRMFADFIISDWEFEDAGANELLDTLCNYIASCSVESADYLHTFSTFINKLPISFVPREQSLCVDEFRKGLAQLLRGRLDSERRHSLLWICHWSLSTFTKSWSSDLELLTPLLAQVSVEVNLQTGAYLHSVETGKAALEHEHLLCLCSGILGIYVTRLTCDDPDCSATCWHEFPSPALLSLRQLLEESFVCLCEVYGMGIDTVDDIVEAWRCGVHTL
jgi:hypothetical protein